MKRILIIFSLSLTVLAPALAREMVSIKGALVNMRSGPSTRAAIEWQLERGYPLQVLQRKGRWLQVRDFENDRGWVARKLTSSTPHYVVKSKVVNVRKGPGAHYRVIGQALRYEVLRTRGKKSDWVRIERANGQRGWVARRLLWGW